MRGASSSTGSHRSPGVWGTALTVVLHALRPNTNVKTDQTKFWEMLPLNDVTGTLVKANEV